MKITLISHAPDFQYINSNNIRNCIFSYTVINGTATSTKILGTSSDTIELRHGQVRNMDSQINEFSAGEVTHQSLNEQFKLATEPIFRQIERLCAQLTDRTDLNSTGSSETNGSRREDTSTNSADNRYDRTTGHLCLNWSGLVMSSFSFSEYRLPAYSWSNIQTALETCKNDFPSKKFTTASWQFWMVSSWVYNFWAHIQRIINLQKTM